jgi:protein-disulfide isomerase
VNIRVLALGIGVSIMAISIVVLVSLDTNSQKNDDSNTLIQPENVDQAKPGGTKIDFSLFSAKATALLGSPSATVTLVEFGDYQCFHCNKFFHNAESEIEKNYIDTGKVKMIFKDFTIIGEDSFSAAHASHCASEEGLFWEYHDTLYNHWTGENNGWASYDNLVEFAKEIGIDENRFEECMKDGRYNSVIEENNSHAKSLGIRGTPAFFIISPNGEVTRVVGSQPYEVFEKIFESALKK